METKITIDTRTPGHEYVGTSSVTTSNTPATVFTGGFRSDNQEQKVRQPCPDERDSDGVAPHWAVEHLPAGA